MATTRREHTGERRLVRRALAGPATTVAAIVLLASLAGAFLSRMLDVAQSFDDAAASLAAVQADVGRLVIYEREARADEPITDAQIAGAIADAQDHLRAARSELRGGSLRDDLTVIDTILADYTARLGELVGMARDGVSTAEANAFHQAFVDPLGDSFADVIGEATANATESARRGRDLAQMGIWSTVAMSVTVAGVLVVRARRAATRLEHNKMTAESDARLRALVEHADELVIVAELDGAIVYESPSVERVLGYRASEMVGRRLPSKVHPDDASSVMSELKRVLAAPGNHSRFDARFAHRDGQWRHLQVDITNKSADAVIGGVVMNARDLSERVSLQSDLAHQARHDPLTGLANRAWFRNELERALLAATVHDADEPLTVSVLLIDLDGFKEVNDRLGHQSGDDVLVTAAARLATLTRHRDAVARLGGDEFAMFVVGDAPEPVAQRIVEMLSAPIRTAGGQAVVSASVGIASATGNANIEALLNGADMAMYDAKERGKNRFSSFSTDMADAARARQQLRDDLDRALQRREFRLVYQPKLRLGDSSVEGFEALVRWHHPTRGVVPPMEFIPFAESSGQIVPLGRWVLREALAQLRVWQEGHAGPGSLTMAVNVSIRQLAEPSIVADVAEELQRSGVDPATVTLEITETMLIADQSVVADALVGLKTLGVRIAVDDYGAGHASINYLRRFPIDILKIDRSFVAALDTDPVEARAYLRSITDLASALSLDLVAEGIEHAEQLDCLRTMGCHLGQGYHLARPLDVHGAAGFLAERAAAPATD